MNLFADFEFNGQQELEAIQFGAIMTDDNCNEISKFNEYVKPQAPVKEYVEHLTGITNQMLQNASEFPTVFRDFVKWIRDNSNDDGHIDFYAWGMDWKQLKKECKNRGCIDAFNILMKGNNRVNYQKVVSKKTTYEGQPMTKALKLGDVKKLYFITDEVVHDALSDAYDVLRIYREIEIKQIKYNENELRRIFNEKRDHIVKMKEEKENQTYNMFKDLLLIYQQKMVPIDSMLFRKIKSGPVEVFYTNIETCINDGLVFSKKKECRYEPGSISLLMTLNIKEKNVYLEYEVYFKDQIKGNFSLFIDSDNKKYVANLLRQCVSNAHDE